MDTPTGQEASDATRQDPGEARSPRGRRTRAALLVAAREVFERDGFLEARITDIAGGAGVSHGTFYTYFAGKEEIFREIISSVQQEMRAHGPTPPPDDDPWARIEHGNRVYIGTYLRNQKIMATLEQVVTFSDDIRQLRREIRRPFLVRNERAIRRWQEAGLADRRLEPRYAASALGAMVDRFMYIWTVLGESFDEEEAVATLTRLWAGALGIAPGRSESGPVPRRSPSGPPPPPVTEVVPPPELEEGLSTVMGQPGRPTTVSGLHRLSGGASAETWAFDVAVPSEPPGPSALPGSPRSQAVGIRPCILRRRPPAGSDKAPITIEAAAMAAAAAVGVPVPAVLTASDDVGVLGSAFMVMERVEGETIPRRILRDEALAPARARFAHDCGRILGALHQADTAAVPGLEADDPLERYRTILDQLGAPSPTFEWAFRHLAATRPDPSPPGLVHGDFRMGNLMVGPEGVRAVLDWELVHLGDPLEDLGWLCTKAWRFGSPAPVGGAGDYDDLLGGYAEVTGRQVPLDALRWWETLGSLKWGIMCLMQASFHLSGARSSVELAAIGRRVAENEWDLLELLP